MEEIQGFQDLTQIGRGGSSSVYRAREVAFDREVALKLFDIELDERQFERFAVECRSIGRLAELSSSIALVFAAGTTGGGRPYLVMRHYSGGSVAARVRIDGPFAVEDVVEIGRRLCGALGAAHSHGVLHRDVKPANVLLDAEGRAVLSDFGIAVLDGGEYTTTSAGLMTPAFAAPERLDGEGGSVVSDVYSLAATLWSLLAGRAPHATTSGDSIGTVIRRVLAGDLRPLDREDVPPQLESALRSALSVDPADRPKSVSEMGWLAGWSEHSDGGRARSLAADLTTHATVAATSGVVSPAPAIEETTVRRRQEVGTVTDDLAVQRSPGSRMADVADLRRLAAAAELAKPADRSTILPPPLPAGEAESANDLLVGGSKAAHVGRADRRAWLTSVSLAIGLIGLVALVAFPRDDFGPVAFWLAILHGPWLAAAALHAARGSRALVAALLPPTIAVALVFVFGLWRDSFGQPDLPSDMVQESPTILAFVYLAVVPILVGCLLALLVRSQRPVPTGRSRRLGILAVAIGLTAGASGPIWITLPDSARYELQPRFEVQFGLVLQAGVALFCFAVVWAAARSVQRAEAVGWYVGLAPMAVLWFLDSVFWFRNNQVYDGTDYLFPTQAIVVTLVTGSITVLALVLGARAEVRWRASA